MIVIHPNPAFQIIFKKIDRMNYLRSFSCGDPMNDFSSCSLSGRVGAILLILTKI